MCWMGGVGFFFQDGVVDSGKVESNSLDEKVTESETEEKGTEEESTRESDGSMLDVSSDYPRGLLLNF